MRILVVCQHFYPENFRINDICFELKKRGHEVTVLTGLPNYPKGKVLREYKWFRNRTQDIKGVRVKRCFLVGRGNGLFRMALNYFCFALFGCFKAFKMKEDYDVVYVYQLSPITMAWPAILFKKKKKIPLVIHCLDQWPISVTTGPISESSIMYKLLTKLSVWTYRKADLITISSRSFRSYFENELHIPAVEKGFLYLPSYAESVYATKGTLQNEKFDIVFAGNIGPAQSCETIIKCANYLKDCDDILFHIVGDGLNKSNCERMAKEYQLNNVVFHGYHDISEMSKYYILADAFIITMVDNAVVNSTLPAKIQSYMLAGKPIFGAISGEVKQVIMDAECGVCTDSHKAKELSKIIRDNYKCVLKLKLWGENGYKYYQKFYEKEKCLDDLENVLKNVIETYRLSD